MKYKYTLAFDPSGNFEEGKGTTGWCVIDNRAAARDAVVEVGSIRASKHETQLSYWVAHISLINRVVKEYRDINVVMEDYLLYRTTALSQVNSRMETSQLIGVIKMHCYNKRLNLSLHKAATVKPRWTCPILAHEGYIQCRHKSYFVPLMPGHVLCDHEEDAIKHGVHFREFEN